MGYCNKFKRISNDFMGWAAANTPENEKKDSNTLLIVSMAAARGYNMGIDAVCGGRIGTVTKDYFSVTATSYQHVDPVFLSALMAQAYNEAIMEYKDDPEVRNYVQLD
jgi:hypothetical protein